MEKQINKIVGETWIGFKNIINNFWDTKQI